MRGGGGGRGPVGLNHLLSVKSIKTEKEKACHIKLFQPV